MCRLLKEHLGVTFGTESQFIVRYHKRIAKYGDLTDDARLRLLLQDISRERFFFRTRRNFGFVFDAERAIASMPSRSYSGVLRAIFDQFAASQGRVRWGDKTPEYCHSLPTLLQLFPDAQFVHVLRDGRDVAQSIFSQGFGAKNAYEAAIGWKETLMQVRRFAAQLGPEAFLEVRYEELLADPLRTMHGIAGFLGIENRDSLEEAIAPRLRAQVRSNNTAKWKEALTSREIECFEAFAGAELTGSGYPLEFRSRNAERSTAEALYWQLQALWRRAVNRRFWNDNWYKAGLRLRDASLPLRSMLRPRLASSPLRTGGRLDS
jgi:hypothetical protein